MKFWHPRLDFLMLAGLLIAIGIGNWAAGQPPEPASKKDAIDLLAPKVAQAGKKNPPATKFNGKRAYAYLRQLCSFGNRMSGSPGMRKQQQLLKKHFIALGGKFEFQQFPGKINPRTGRQASMANIIVRWNPEATERILLCAHYDTRPLPDRDPNPRLAREGEFLGANDGASGVAVLMEMAHHVGGLTDRYGIDFVLFDAEEFIFDERRDKFFLGSEYFARQYRDNRSQYRYVAGVLLDMVGDAKLTVYQERYSATWADTRPIVQEIWSTAERLGIKEFIPRVGYEVRDDHVPLHQIGKIPICDIIDFQYPDRKNRYWHTTADAPGRCSADSLGKVGFVIQEWLATKP